jgi:small subunit ribosomal protein S8e
MVIIQKKSNRKPTGGKYKASWKKNLDRMGRSPSLTKIGEKSLFSIRTKGGGDKLRLLIIDVANVYNPKTKKYSKEKIAGTSANPANRHFARRSIITKGSIIETAKGKARITSRPGQEGTVNAVLIEEKK